MTLTVITGYEVKTAYYSIMTRYMVYQSTAVDTTLLISQRQSVMLQYTQDAACTKRINMLATENFTINED